MVSLRRSGERQRASVTSHSSAKLRRRGSKDDKINRLVENYIQPSVAIAAWSAAALKDVCRDLGLTSSGGKDELVERLGQHVARNSDLQPETEPPPPPPPEERVLSMEHFTLLFSTLRGSDLSDVLSGVGSKRSTGSKDKLLEIIRETRFKEETLLLELDLKQLEWLLDRLRLKSNGTKADRVMRLIEYFAKTPIEQLSTDDSPSSD